MVKSIFMALAVPLMHILLLSLVYTAGAESVDIRTFVAYVVIVNAIPFLVAQAIFSVWIFWKHLSSAPDFFLAFSVSHISTTLAQAFWPRGTYLDGATTLLLATHLFLLTIAFGLSWACWLTYHALTKPDPDR